MKNKKAPAQGRAEVDKYNKYAQYKYNVIHHITFFNPPPALVLSGYGARRYGMLSYVEFAKRAEQYLRHIEITRKNARKIAEILFYLASELEEIENITVVDDLHVKRKSVFESKNFKRYYIESVTKEIEKSQCEEKTKIKKIINRAYYSKNDVISQKKAMLANKSRSSNLDLILSAIDISSDDEISQMYVTVKALQCKLDPIVYKKLRERAKKEFGSCRIDARYFLYILRRIEEFENELANEEEKQEMELTKADKIEKKNRKIHENVEIRTSETDFKKYTKGEKLTKETKYKLYIYRKMYESELKNTKLSRLSKDDLLFFLINVEKLIENRVINIDKAINIIKYADSNHAIKNPIGWLITRFMISRGRFYFLLRKSNPKSSEDEKQPEKHHQKQKQEKSREKQTERRGDTYIREDLAYFILKYSVPYFEISKYVNSLRLRGDVSVAVEQYVILWLWKNYLSREEKQKLIRHAKNELKKFVTPPSKEEAMNYIKSIIRNKIREEYLTLTIEDKIRLFSQKQHSNLQQHYDTS